MQTKYILREFEDARGRGVCLVDVGDASEDAVRLVVHEWRGPRREQCWADARRMSRRLCVREVRE